MYFLWILWYVEMLLSCCNCDSYSTVLYIYCGTQWFLNLFSLHNTVHTTRMYVRYDTNSVQYLLSVMCSCRMCRMCRIYVHNMYLGQVQTVKKLFQFSCWLLNFNGEWFTSRAVTIVGIKLILYAQPSLYSLGTLLVQYTVITVRMHVIEVKV